MRRASGFGLVEEFQTIRGLLEDLDYVVDWQLTPRGERLRRIYNESDLLVAECVERGLLYGLETPELAALLSVFVYEPRTDNASAADWPTPVLHERWSGVEELWEELNAREREARLAPTRRPDPGFGMLAFQWASGAEFDDLTTRGMAPGDFVRVSRQLTDLIRQLRDAAREMSEDGSAVLKAVDRGVVAAQGVG
jgi:ATP-dependent RNA helicase HelY